MLISVKLLSKYVLIIAVVHQPAADDVLERFEIFRSMVGDGLRWFDGSAVCLSKCLAAAPLFFSWEQPTILFGSQVSSVQKS